MKKRKFILLGVVVVLIALLLEAGILNNVNNRNTYQTSQVLLDRVINVLDRNTQSEEELINSLKDDYIVRAKAVAYIIDAKPEAEKDVDELRKIANLMSVDEVHLFDKDGTFIDAHVYWGRIIELRIQAVMNFYQVDDKYFDELCSPSLNLTSFCPTSPLSLIKLLGSCETYIFDVSK